MGQELWFDDDYYTSRPYQNPQGPSSGTYKITRGGGWSHTRPFARVVYRDKIDPDVDYRDLVGFRCADSPGE